MENALKSSAKKPEIEKEERVYRTIHARLPLELLPACRSAARHLRDVKNSATWLVRTALLCFGKDPQSKSWTLKPEARRPTNWKEALDAFDGAIAEVNADRKAKGKGKAFVQLAGGANDKPLSTILDQTIFHKACRERVDGLDPEKKTAASRIPANLAKAGRAQVLTNFSTWSKSLSAWSTNKNGISGMPQMPGFIPKGKLPAIDFPLTDTSQRFPKLDKFEMKLGEDKALDLTTAEKASWNAFALRKLVDDSVDAWAKAMRHPKGSATPKAVRVRILRTKLKLDIVVELPRTFPEGSFLQELKTRHVEDWDRQAGEPATLEAWVREIIQNQAWLGQGDAWIAAATAAAVAKPDPYAWVSERFEIVGGDPGETNLISLGFSAGVPMMAFCGKAYGRKMDRFDASIDRLASTRCSSEQKALQAKRQALKAHGHALPQAELSRLRSLSAQLWADPQILALREKKSAFALGEMHRLASACAKAARDGGAAVFVLSRNLGLKNAAGRSAKQERKAHNIPHSTFAKLLREKLETFGIALVETEESFTSQASFVDGDPMGVHSQGRKQEVAKAKRAQSKLAKKTDQSEQKTASAKKTAERSTKQDPQDKTPSGAKRSSDRLWLDRGLPLKPAPAPRANPHRRRRVHADGQAALNAIRKVCPAFACSSKVNLAHELWMLDGGCWRLWDARKPRGATS